MCVFEVEIVGALIAALLERQLLVVRRYVKKQNSKLGKMQ